MRRIITYWLLLVALSPAVAYAEVSRKIVKNTDRTEQVFFYSGGREVAKKVLDEDGNVIKTIGKIPDGIVKEYYESGKLKSEWNYKNGKLEGICKTYYESGELMFKYNYKEGKQDGITRSYYRNGRLKYEYKYRDGKLEGTIKKYYRNGKLAFEWNYKDGKREGITKSYYRSGSQRAEWNYGDNRLDGITRIYYENGGIQYIDTYKNGQKVNRKAYDSKGKLEFDQDYPVERKEIR